LSVSEQELHQALYSSTSRRTQSREDVFNTQLDHWVKELKRVGVTRQLLWQEYRQAYPEGYGYSQFCERLRRYIERRDLTMVLSHPPAQAMYLDFAGKRLQWVDRTT
ncbi:MAG: IS21 family transposase, partial [Bacteroidota bacterium]